MHGAPSPYPYPKHHVRFYLVLVTLVLGALFYVLMTNSQFSVKSLTGSSVGVFQKKNVSDEAVLSEEGKEVPQGTPFTPGREMNLLFSFDHVPTLNQETKVAELEVRFADPQAHMNVNNDQLELQNLPEVTLKVKDFAGKLQVDSLNFALEGVAKRIEVNGVAFSGKTGLSISLDSVDYQYVLLYNVKVKDLAFPRGNGDLDIGEKFKYALEQEELRLHGFVGKILIDQQNTPLATLEGIVQGVDVEGTILNVGVR